MDPRPSPSSLPLTVRALVVVALAAAGLVLFSSAAAAEPVIGVPGTGGGSASQGSNPGGATPCVRLDGGLGYGRWVVDGTIIYNAPYPPCNDDGSGPWLRSSSEGATYRHAGWEVWRFYGTFDNPAQAMTVSQVNLPAWGVSETVVPWAHRSKVFAPHPDDAGAHSHTSPWYHQSGQNPHGQVFSRAEPNVGEDAFVTTRPPFRTSGSCTDLQSRPNPLSRYFQQPLQPEEQSIRDGVWSLFRHYQPQGENTALAVINATSATGPNNIGWDDGRDCSSGFDFIRDVADNPDDRVVFGVCYMPTQRTANIFRNPQGDAMLGFRARFGDRYVAPDGAAQPDLPASIDSAWRNRLHNEISTRNTRPYRQPGDQPTPGAPFNRLASGGYPQWQDPVYRRDQAANFARDNAICAFGVGSSTSAQTTRTEGRDGDQVQITVTRPDVANVGGATQWVTFEANASQLLCGNRPCGGEELDPQLVELDFDLRIEGDRDYVQCDSRDQAGCDYTIMVEERSNRRPGVLQQHRIIAEFYRATMPDESLTLHVDNITATQRVFTQDAQELYIDGCTATTEFRSPDAGGGTGTQGTCEPVTLENITHEDVPVATSVRYQDRDGAPSSPHVTVVGSVNEPR